MSNTLDKLFVTDYTLVPGYTIRRWVPAVTNVVTNNVPRWVAGEAYSYTYEGSGGFAVQSPYYIREILDSEGKTTAIIYYAYDGSWTATISYTATGSTTTISGMGAGYWVYDVVNTTVTTPGYYAYDVQPDTYTQSYNPNNGWNSAARSIASILGDGTAIFTPRVDVAGAVVGLNEIPDSFGVGYTEITYGLYFSRGIYRVIEQGVSKGGNLQYVAGDVFSISRTNEDIFYAINDQVFYKSLTPSATELLLDCSLYSGGDEVYDASLSDVSNVVARTADILAVGTLYAQPKAVAEILTQSTLGFNGVYQLNDQNWAYANIATASLVSVNQDFGNYPNITAQSTLDVGTYSIDDEIWAYATITASSLVSVDQDFGGYPTITATATLSAIGHLVAAETVYSAANILTTSLVSVLKDFGGYPTITSTSTITATSHFLEGMIGSMSPMTASATSGYEAYAEINGSMSPMTANAGDSAITQSFSYIAGAFEGMTMDARCLTGENTLENTASLSPMTALSADHAYAAISGSFSSMQGWAGEYPVMDNYAIIAAPSLSFSATGHSNLPNSVTAGFITSTMEALGGWNGAGGFLTSSLSATGTLTEAGTANLPFITTTLTATMNVDERAAGALGFISSTLTGLGGANAAFSAPTFTFLGTGTDTYGDRGNADLSFITTSISITGTMTATGAASLGFISSYLTATSGNDSAVAQLGFTLPTLSASGTMDATGVVYAGFVTTYLTATVTVEATATAQLGFIESSLSATGGLGNIGVMTGGFVNSYLSYAAFNLSGPVFSLSCSGSEVIAAGVAYVFNTRTQESTTYSNYPFTGIIHIGRKPYGVKSDGLYLLEGTADIATAINGSITTKDSDFGFFASKNIEQAYLNSDTLTTLTPIVDGVAALPYPSSFGGRRVAIARGLAGRYWQFKIDGIQKLEGLEATCILRQRSVK